MADLPADYETCGTCGFDHDYEPHHSSMQHIKLLKEEAEKNGDCEIISLCDLASEGDAEAFELVSLIITERG